MTFSAYARNNTLYAADEYLYNRNTVATGITATASGTQSTSSAVSSAVNVISTVATTNDGVCLPLAVVGYQVVIVNAGANTAKVFGSGTDTINDVAYATGVTQASGKTALYVCTATAPAGKWYRLLSA